VLTPYDLFIVTAAMLDDWQESLYKMWMVDIDTKDDSSKHWFRGEDLLKFFTITDAKWWQKLTSLIY
jgi:hypothetical protein